MALAGTAREGRHCELPLHPFGCAKGVRRRGNLIFCKVRLPRRPSLRSGLLAMTSTRGNLALRIALPIAEWTPIGAYRRPLPAR
jgi:hypothetical protein